MLTMSTGFPVAENTFDTGGEGVCCSSHSPQEINWVFPAESSNFLLSTLASVVEKQSPAAFQSVVFSENCPGASVR